MARSSGSSRRQSARLDRVAREAAACSPKSEGNPDRHEAGAPSAPAVRVKSSSRNIAAVKRWQSKAAIRSQGISQCAAKERYRTGGIASSYNDSLQVARAFTNPRVISPPGSNVVWRAGRSGMIEFSKDGSTWSRQVSGVLVDLLNGSAPSDQVCWIVGRAGAILLTTDGGAHWKVVQSPLAEDLGGVRASDALHATIWNARSTKSFQTSDGGITWMPIPSP